MKSTTANLPDCVLLERQLKQIHDSEADFNIQ